MEEHEKIIARIEQEFFMENANKEEHCTLRERIARLEEKNIAAADALKLAKDSVSINFMISIGTIIISIVAIAIHFIK